MEDGNGTMMDYQVSFPSTSLADNGWEYGKNSESTLDIMLTIVMFHDEKEDNELILGCSFRRGGPWVAVWTIIPPMVAIAGIDQKLFKHLL